MRRPIYVRQQENHDISPPVFWYTVGRGNGQPMTTSETYPSRSNAVRGARAFIAAISPVPVLFSYWTGRVGAMRFHEELIRGAVPE